MFKAFLYIPDISRYLGCWSVAIYQREGKYHFGWVTVRLYSTAHLQYQQHPKPLSVLVLSVLTWLRGTVNRSDHDAA